MENDVEIVEQTSNDGEQETIVVLMDEDDSSQPKPPMPTIPQETSNATHILKLNLSSPGLVTLTSDEIASQKQEPGDIEPVESRNNQSKRHRDTEESSSTQDPADSNTKDVEHSSSYTGKENLVGTNGPIGRDTSEGPIDMSTDVVHIEQDPVATGTQKLDITQCLQIVKQDQEDNTVDLVTPHLDVMQRKNMSSRSFPSDEQIRRDRQIVSVSNELNAPGTTIPQISKIVTVHEAQVPSCSNIIVPETYMKQNPDTMDFQQPALNLSSIADAAGRQNTDTAVTQVPDVTMHHDYTVCPLRCVLKLQIISFTTKRKIVHTIFFLDCNVLHAVQKTGKCIYPLLFPFTYILHVNSDTSWPQQKPSKEGRGTALEPTAGLVT